MSCNISKIHSLLSAVILLAIAFLAPSRAKAFELDSYASESVLASGHWVKVCVAETGIHFIPASTLRSWGFTRPENVSIYGYGGKRLPDRLSRAEYKDDLPLLQTVHSADGIYFYAVGPIVWTRSSQNYYTHTRNPFSDYGFYFLTDSRTDDRPREIPEAAFDHVTSTPVTTFTDHLFHEKDLVSPGLSGHLFVGEDFRQQRSQTFSFDLPDHVEDTPVWLRSTFVSAVSSLSTITYSANGTELSARSSVSAINEYNYAIRTTMSTDIHSIGDKLEFGITFQPSGIPQKANLDAIIINYTRRLSLFHGQLAFTLRTPSASLADASENTVIWDVTDPLNIYNINATFSNGTLSWTNTYSGERNYAAWTPGATYPVPQYVGAVSNQNLHSSQTQPDMVIFTVSDWAGEANRLAEMHRNGARKLAVNVVVQDEVFNEFSSGVPDVNAFRHYLKMVYDRGKAAGHPLRYVLMFGRATFDNRLISPEMKAAKEPYMPTWQTDEGLSVYSSFSSDDPIAMLEDKSGSSMATSAISVALGRAPIHSLTNAKTFVDKAIAYSKNSYATDWKNQVVLMADNGDLGVFMKDSERQYANFMSTESGANMFYTKVYIDAFNIIGGSCEGGRKRLHRMLDEGTLWWNYIGHAATTTLSEENLMTSTDINKMYNRRWPIFFGATCSFARHDRNELSGSEIMTLTPGGGTIAAIAPTRESMITHNGVISAAFGTKAFERDENGEFGTIGDIYRNAKNHLVKTASREVNNQKLYYVLLGDPALLPATPSSRVALEQIDGIDVTPDNQCTIKARQRVKLSGAVYDPAGNIMDDFNGTVSLTMYDAEYSTTSNGAYTGGGKPTQGEKVTFEEQGEKIYVGRDSIRNGRFEAVIAMPSEVSDNFRPAALNMFARSADGREAIGCNREFYVYGFDEDAEPDTEAPTIEYAYLNHETFTEGSVVNESPMFIAKVSDNVGINLSSAGVGHQMSLKLDGSRSINDVAFYYTPSADGTPSGTIAYPLESLAEGNHSLSFRVWDTSGNSTTKTVDFFVEQGAAPKVFDIWADVSPASVEANFYLTHNRPDATLTVSLDIYDISGRHVWTTKVTNRSDMFLSAPIHWDLTDMGGHRVARGIYIYRATVSADGHDVTTSARRIAVTGR